VGKCSSGGISDDSLNTTKGSGSGEGVWAWEDEKTDWVTNSLGNNISVR
jgi:hypothetical protein